MSSKWPPENSWKHLLLFEQSYTNKKQQYTGPIIKQKETQKNSPGPAPLNFLLILLCDEEKKAPCLQEMNAGPEII